MGKLRNKPKERHVCNLKEPLAVRPVTFFHNPALLKKHYMLHFTTQIFLSDNCKSKKGKFPVKENNRYCGFRKKTCSKLT